MPGLARSVWRLTSVLVLAVISNRGDAIQSAPPTTCHDLTPKAAAMRFLAEMAGARKLPPARRK